MRYTSTKNHLQPWRSHTYQVWVKPNEDGTVDIEGTIAINHSTLQTLDAMVHHIGIIRNIDGSFFCNDNKLTSLKGCPQHVNGHFSCQNNKLTSLEGGPHTVVNEYKCFGNNLQNLNGAPTRVGETFSIYYNPGIFIRLSELKSLVKAGDYDFDYTQIIPEDPQERKKVLRERFMPF